MGDAISVALSCDPMANALADLLRPVLGLDPRGEPPQIDAAMVEFARSRHRVGPLLHIAARRADPERVDEDAARALTRLYRNNAKRTLTQRAALNDATALLEAHGIASVAIKGAQLGVQLYGDSAARHAKDIDILIAPGDARAACDVMRAAGYLHCFDIGAMRSRWPAWRMRVLKDTGFDEPGTGRTIELHQRLFPIEPRTLTPDFIMATRGEAVATIANDHYILYLILHGAMGYWPRLKWLADLSALIRTVADDRVAALRDLAGRYDCVPAILASLRLVEEVFSGSLHGAWKEWAEDQGSHAAAQRLLVAYRASLSGSDPAAPSQPLRKDSFPTASWHVFAGAIPRASILARRVAMASLTQFERLVR